MSSRYGRGIPPKRLIRPALIFPTLPVGKYAEDYIRTDDQSDVVIDLTQWRYRRLVTIDQTVVDADLTDYPAIVKLTSSNFDFGKALPDGSDIVFVTNDGTNRILDFEKERYDDFSRAAEFWVKVPLVSGTVNTTFWMYYGNDFATTYANQTDVWDQYFAGVYHMDEDGGVSGMPFNDSTGIGLGGTPTGLTGNSRQLAMFAQGQIFDGSTCAINIARANSVMGSTQYTVSAWVTVTALGAQRVIVEEGRGDIDGSTRFKFALNSSNQFALFGRDLDTAGFRTLATNTSVTAVADGTYYFVTAVYDSTNDTNFVTVNGTKVTTTDTDNVPISNTVPMADTYIGRRNDAVGEFWSGKIDEVRISRTARSDAWIKADYNGGLGTLLVVGSEVQNDQAITASDTARFSDVVTPTTAFALPLVLNRQALNPSVTPIAITRPDTGVGVDTGSVNVLASDTGSFVDTESVSVGGTPVSSSDTGTANETTSIAATLSSADIQPAATDSGSTLTDFTVRKSYLRGDALRFTAQFNGGVVTVSAADTGTSVEANAPTTAVVSSNDPRTSTESGSTTAVVTGTDTGTDTENTSTIDQASTDVGTSVETSNVVAATVGADTGSGAEGTALIAFTRTDTGSSTETSIPNVLHADTSSSSEASSITASLTGTDTGSDAEASTITVQGSDVGSSAEVGATVVAIVGSDTGSSVEANAAVGVSGSTEAGSTSETTSLAAALSGSDTSSSADVGSIAVTSAELGSSTEATSIASAFTNTDTSTGVEGTPTISFTRTDTGSGAESGSQNVLTNDTSAGSEGAGTIAFTAGDTSTSAESGSVSGSSSPSDNDTGSSTEAGSTTATLSTTETGSASEAALIAFSTADPVSAAEATSVAVVLSSADTGSASEVGVVGITGADTRPASVESGSTTATLSAAETAAGTEASTIGVVGSDTGTDTEAGSAGTSVVSNDVSSSVEAVSTFGIAVGVGETGSAAETSVVAVTSSDTGSSSDVGAIAVTGGDTGTGGDTTSVGILANDQRSSVESQTIAATLSSTDAASGIDVGIPLASLSSSDVGGGSEGPSNIGLAAADARTSTESGSIFVSVSANDLSSAVEALGTLVASLVASDSGTGLEGWVVDTGHLFTWTFKLEPNGGWVLDDVYVNWTFAGTKVEAT